MLVLIEALRVLLSIILAPFLWLMSWAGWLMVWAAPVFFFIDVPHRILWAFFLLLFGVIFITLTNLVDGMNAAVKRWIYFRQQFYVARKIPGRSIRATFGRYLDDHAVAETTPHPARTGDLD